jgi:hypothetical protein
MSWRMISLLMRLARDTTASLKNTETKLVSSAKAKMGAETRASETPDASSAVSSLRRARIPMANTVPNKSETGTT